MSVDIFCTYISHILHIYCTYLAQILHKYWTYIAHNCTYIAHISHIYCTNIAHILHKYCTYIAHILHIYLFIYIFTFYITLYTYSNLKVHKLVVFMYKHCMYIFKDIRHEDNITVSIIFVNSM